MGNLEKATEATDIEALINKSWKETQQCPWIEKKESHRTHLGGSQIGGECLRALFYGFFWCNDHEHEGQLLRLFERGNREEDYFVKLLEEIGIKVKDVSPKTGKQFKISDCDGHFGGSLDGVGINIPGAEKTVHLLEFKTINDKGFKLVKSKEVEEARPGYYAQVQIYMYKKKLKRTLICFVNKNTDELYFERIKIDVKFAKELIKKADYVIHRNKPPVGISKDPAFWKCKMCDHNAICHGAAIPAVNCRTCIFSKPIENGKWHCKKNDEIIPTAWQRLVHECHVFRHDLLPFEEIGSTPKSIKYVNDEGVEFENGEKGRLSYLSVELQNIDSKLIGDPNVEDLREDFDGKIVHRIDDDNDYSDSEIPF